MFWRRLFGLALLVLPIVALCPGPVRGGNYDMSSITTTGPYFVVTDTATGLHYTSASSGQMFAYIADLADTTGEGLELTFEVTVEGASRGYLVAVFVIDGWRSNTIATVEFVATKSVFEKHLQAVRKAISTLEP